MTVFKLKNFRLLLISLTFFVGFIYVQGLTSHITYASTDPCNAIYKLRIRGTVKSSNVFVQEINPDTREITYVDVRKLTPELLKGKTVVKNVPVNGALIQIHDSQKLDQYPKHTEYPGMIDGMIRLGYKNLYTKPDGTFLIEAESHCGKGGNVWREDWRGVGYEQYLSVSCADKINGEEKIAIKDVIGYILNKPLTPKDEEVNLGDIQVDCQAIPWQAFPGAKPPEMYTDFTPRSKEVYMACSGMNNVTRSGQEIYNHQPWDLDVIFKDEWSNNSLLGIIGRILDGTALGQWLRDHVPFNGRTENRTSPQTQLYPMEEHALNIDNLLGTRGATLQKPFVKIPKYYLDEAPADVPTFNGHEEKPFLVDCDTYRRCSRTLSEKANPMDNSQTCGGMWNNLAPPFGGMVRVPKGDKMVYDERLSGDVNRYQELPKNRLICAGGDGIRVWDIMPPRGFCGDINKNGVVEGLPREMPCPETFICGDVNMDGKIRAEDNEKDCSTVMMEGSEPGVYNVPSRYKYDVRYFPYSALYSFTVVNHSEAQSQTSRITDDNYESMCPRGVNNDSGYQEAEGAGETSKPLDQPCVESGPLPYSLTWYQQTETKFPCTDWTCYQKDQNTEVTTWVHNPPPAGVLGTPQFIKTNDSRAKVDQTIAKQAATVTTKRTGNFFRIGVPQDLCTCNIVENGTNTTVPELKNCNQMDAQIDEPPETIDPGNIFTPVRDEIAGDEIAGGDYHLRVDYPTINWDDHDTPSKVGGGGDWEGLDHSGGTLWTNNRYMNTHYDQSVSNTLSKMIGDLVETIECFIGSVPNNTNDRTGHCGREVRHVAKADGMTRGGLPEQVKNGQVLLNAVDPPSWQLDQIEIKTSATIDRTMTKPERIDDGNAYGFNSEDPKLTSNLVLGSQGSAYNLNYGVAKKIQRDKFMDAAGTPIFPIKVDPPAPPAVAPPVGGPPVGPPPEPPGPPGPGGPCDFTLSQSCSCGGITVSASGVWTGAVGDLMYDIKDSDGNTVCAGQAYRWGGGGVGCSGSMHGGTFTCHHVLNYNGNGCNTNVTNRVTCP